MDWSVWLAFFAASWVISISPGAGAVFAMSNGLAHGFTRGYVATIGLILGIWTLLAVVALGLGALLASSTWAFSAVKWFGVCYLIWLGVMQWRAVVPAAKLEVAPTVASVVTEVTANADGATSINPMPSAAQSGAALSSAAPELFNWRKILVKAWAINATNPKGVLFMLAVVPQFIQPAKDLLPQYLVIGATLAFTDMVVMAGYTLLAAKVLRLMQGPQHVRLMNRLFGGLFIGAGMLLATFKRT